MRKIFANLLGICGLLPINVGQAAETSSYKYDAQGRLVAVIREGTGALLAYTYDKAGNRTAAFVASADSAKIPIFRLCGRKNHFYTASYSEGYGAGLIFEAPAFDLLTSGLNAHPLYRCISGMVDHFVSADGNCEGNTVEGLLGYAANSQSEGLLPLYRFDKPVLSDQLITVNCAEGANNGYIYEGILGYVPLNN